MAEAEIAKAIERMHSIDIELQSLIDDFRKDQEWDEFGSVANVKMLRSEPGMQNLSPDELKDVIKRKIQKRNSIVKKINKKSRVFIEDSFLKFHLLENVLFYVVLFSVPMLSVIGCHEGHSSISYVAIGAFMLCIFIIDIVNLRYHINKELLKLSIMKFYGKRREYKYL